MNLKLRLIFLTGLSFLFVTSTIGDNKEWWKTSNFYQIYPRSFQSYGDRKDGDLDGITQRLPYLKEIGITAIWLSPIFKSPMIDTGYDISDYKEIDPMFGSQYYFERLIEKAHNFGIKIILDFVPNHSSDQHEWFKKSVNREEDFEDYYVWRDGKKDDNNATNLLPPNNWRSVFGGSAWTYHETRKQFYYHQFYKEQPDLNFRNEKVRKEMEQILIHWLDKEVDGFRVDSASHIYEDERFHDEPKIPNVDPMEYNSLAHIYTYDQNETFDIMYEWRQILDKYSHEKGGDDRVLFAETYSTMEKKIKYYGSNGKKGAQFPFNFGLLNLNKLSTADEYAKIVKDYMNALPKNEIPNWVIGNHDQQRVPNRVGRDKATLLNLFMLSLPGITVTYYGEEIGMENIELPMTITDIRYRARSPMHWSDDDNAGFSKKGKPWLPVAPDYKTRNVKVQRQRPLSYLNQFKAMLKIRSKYNFYDTDKFSIAQSNESLVIITRGDIDILLNVGMEKQGVTLSDRKYSEVLLMNEHSKRRIGDTLSTRTWHIYPNEVLVLKKINYNSIAIK